MTHTLTVLVPIAGSRAALAIDPGSGVVTATTPGGPDAWVDVHYEGNRFGAANLVTYEQKLVHAADRLLTHYPTVAKGRFPAAEFLPVGFLAMDTGPGQSHALVVMLPDAIRAWTQEGESNAAQTPSA